MRLAFTNRNRTLAGQTPTHLYLWPHPVLRPYVAHYTLCLGKGGPPPAAFPPLTILPDASGCLVFTLAGDTLSGLLYGPSSRAVRMDNDLGVCPLRFFVEFRPGGWSAFTRIPLWELTDQAFSLEDGEQALNTLVQDCWRRTADLDDFVQTVDRALRARLTDDGKFSGLLARFLSEGGDRELLSAETGYSPRHLSRLFRSRCGLSPKGLERILRINAAARRIQTEADCSLTRLAQDLGYFDQAHFIHAFREVCGVAPGVYRAELSDFYNEPLKF